MKTADGSPRRRAMVSSSEVVLRTSPSTWSTRTRTSAMSSGFPSEECAGRSDELLRGQELGQLRAAVTLVGDDLALLARRALREGLDLGPGGVEADLGGVDPEVAQRPRLDRLLLGRHDPLERGVARLVDLVGDRHQGRERGRDRLGGGVSVAADGRVAAL